MGQASVAGGVPIHGEFSSADASALSEPNSRFALYGPGSTSAVTLAAADTVAVSDLVVTVGAAMTVQVYDGADNAVGAGELVAKLVFAAAGRQAVPLLAPHYCQAGTYPKIKTSAAGQVDVQMRGGVLKLT